MRKIAFETISSAFTILNPQNNFAEETHQVEVRKDPLLGDRSVYNPFLRDKANAFFGRNDPDLIKELVVESAKNCIFCGTRIEESTPRYPADLVPQGRIRSGEALLFPNLFAIGAYHAVVSLSRNHFLNLSEYSPALVENGLKAALEFLKKVFRTDPEARFVTINANYLFPAGASLVHPHLQILITPVAYSFQGRMIDACRAYYLKNGSTYHADLIVEEKKSGARYVAQRGNWHWLTAFSPMGSNEIVAVHESESDFAAMAEADLGELAAGISKSLELYERLGYLSFNYSLFSVRQSAGGEGNRCLLKLINRQNLYPNYRNDDYFLQKMLQTELITNPPEDLAISLRSLF
jgi:UDPglucose--hexose-1-phosphate uridylyltransferase